MRQPAALCLAWALIAGLGCAQRRNQVWHGPAFAEPAPAHVAWKLPTQPDVADASDYEAIYAEAMRSELQGLDACVDLYLQAGLSSGQWLYHGDAPSIQRAWRVYHSSVAKLLETAPRFGRVDGGGGLQVVVDGRLQTLPVTCHGFVWRPESFGQIVLVGDYPLKEVKHRHARSGLGVPVVVLSRQEGFDPATHPFVPPGMPFAATAILRQAAAGSGEPTAVLELHDPLRTAGVSWNGQVFPLTADLTAPLAMRQMTADRSPWLWFLEPEQGAQRSSLIFIEPYQPGKIPVVFVHGLLSDPGTWIDLVNDLRAVPEIAGRYQFWAFRYPTGNAFLRSAAELRSAISAAAIACDPQQTEPALRQMVVVGHSMGGLLAKLQVSHSGDTLWNSVANQPLDSIQAEPATKHALSEALFFSPHPCVRRVVFMATPHGGSSFATRFAGRVGSMLVQLPPERVAEHQRLVCDNPGVFARFVQRRLPTSVDMLEPSSPLLQAVRCLSVDPQVRMHSIIGTGYLVVGDGEGDGIVSIHSAQHENVLSELRVRAGHTDSHHNPQAKAELIAILQGHAFEFNQEVRGAAASTSPAQDASIAWQQRRK